MIKKRIIFEEVSQCHNRNTAALSWRRPSEPPTPKEWTTIIGTYGLTEGGRPVGRIADGDSVIFCCRRGEREIELTDMFTDPGFAQVPRRPLKDLYFAIMTLYHEKFKDLPIALRPPTWKCLWPR